MSVLINGKTTPAHYRKFNINSLSDGEINDYGSLREVLVRRLSYLVKDKNRRDRSRPVPTKRKKDPSFNSKPDLILIDGGKGQLSSALEALQHYKLKIPLLSIAKREEEIFTFIKNKIIKLNLPKNSELNLLLQRLRDEAHRFGHTASRKAKSKEFSRSQLDDIEGIGNTKKKKLLQTFGSINAIKNANDNDLLKIISKKDLLKIREGL
jgi:excinuclease ABC subunit C